MKLELALIAFNVMLSILIVVMWFYMLHWILAQLNAPPSLWALYWVYLPTALVAAIVGKIIEQIGD